MNSEMEYAIKQLEEVENILKETIDNLAEFEVEAKKLRENLSDVQTAILVLNASKEILAIAQTLSLKKQQK